MMLMLRRLVTAKRAGKNFRNECRRSDNSVVVGCVVLVGRGVIFVGRNVGSVLQNVCNLMGNMAEHRRVINSDMHLCSDTQPKRE
jgi:hypothetical protein